MHMRKLFCVGVAAFVAGELWGSFGPLVPSATPCEREYIWPEGKMPDVQAHQIAAKTAEKSSQGSKAENFRRPYIKWYAPNPATACSEGLGAFRLYVKVGGNFTSPSVETALKSRDPSEVIPLCEKSALGTFVP